MRIVVSGSVVSNGGDAAIMQAQIRVMESAFPGAEVVILDSRPDVAARIFSEARCAESILPTRLRTSGRRARSKSYMLRRRLLWAGNRRRTGRATGPLLPAERAALDLIDGADLVAYTGGTTLTEKYQMLPKLIELEVAAALGKPTVLLPQSMGPFTRPEIVTRIRDVVTHASIVLLRDARSREHLHEIGADMNAVVVVPDIVLAETAEAAVARLGDSAIGDRPSVVISARSVAAFSADGPAGQARYNHSMSELVLHLVHDLDASVTFISTCQGLASYNHDDSAIAQSIADLLPHDVAARVVVDREFHTPDQLHELYSKFDLAVVTRLHAGITALNVGLPVLAIAYEFKTHEVMGALGAGDYVVDIADLGGDELSSRIKALLDDLPHLRPILARKLEAAAADARACGRRVADAIALQS